MEIVEVDLGEVALVEGPPFEGSEAFVVAFADGGFVGTCFAPWAPDGAALARAVEARLHATIAARAVERAVGDPAAWIAPATPPSSELVTVVVCTIDRLIELRRCLTSVLPQLRPGDEVVVVDNSSTGSAEAVAARFGARWVVEHRPGSGWARNRGLASAEHDVVVYIDDDCVADRRWLDAMREPFADATVDVTTGGVLARRADLAVPGLIDARQPFHRGWSRRRFEGSTRTSLSPHDPWVVGTGASMAWRRGALERLGGFDPALGSGTPMRACEDLDAFRRLLAGGGVVVYEPGALVWHDHPETLRALRRKLVAYSVGIGAHLAKVTMEERGRGNARAAVMATWWDAVWQLRSARREAMTAVRRRPHLPLLAVAAHPAGVAVGAARFARHRHRVRDAR